MTAELINLVLSVFERSTHPKLRSQVVRIRLIHLLPADQNVLELLMVRLVYSFLERFVTLMLVRLECGDVLRNFLIPVHISLISRKAANRLTTRR